MIAQLSAFDRSLELPGLDAIEQQVPLLGQVSRDLRPIARSLSTAFGAIRQIQASVAAWQRALE